MRPRPVVGKATVPDAVRRLLDKFEYPDRETPSQVVPILDTLGAADGLGAFVHLTRNATQSISASGELISWDVAGAVFGFGETVPTTTVTILQGGYYNIGVQFGWDTFQGGGTTTVQKNGVTVWPPADDPGLWSTAAGILFEGTAPAIDCVAGDTIGVHIDPDDASAQTLESATLAVYLVDRTPALDAWELVFVGDGDWGVVWDPNREVWWTSDFTNSIDPAFFERSTDGTTINSYTGWDSTSSRGMAYLDNFLWCTGFQERVYKVDPSDGSVDSWFSSGGVGLTVGGITSDGATLFFIEQDTDEIREVNTAGTLLNTDTFPTGHELVGIASDGANFWATTLTDTIIKMAGGTFTLLAEIEGPAQIATKNGCHYKDGYLYVMGEEGLYRRSV